MKILIPKKQPKWDKKALLRAAEEARKVIEAIEKRDEEYELQKHLKQISTS